MSDIIEQAQSAHAMRWETPGPDYPDPVPTGVVWLGDWASEYLPELVAELKAARAVAFPPACDCGGRLCLLPAADERHGSNNGYSNHGCRCTPCRNDHAAEKRRKNSDA